MKTEEKYFAWVDAAYASLSGPALRERLQELTEQAREEYGESSGIYAAMLNEWGGYCRGQRVLSEAECAFRQSLAIVGRNEGERSTSYATTLNNLAGVHRLMERWEEAEQEFRVCLGIYRASVGEKHILYASALNNLSLVYLDKAMLEKAAQCLSQAQEILQAIPGCEEELATSYGNLAVLYREMGSPEKAERLLRKALCLYEGKLGTRTPHYHAALYELGLVCRSQEHWKEAAEKLSEAAAAAEKLYGPDHPETRAAKEQAVVCRRMAEGRQ